MTTEREIELHLTRRQLFGLSARGIGGAALGSLLSPNVAAGVGLTGFSRTTPRPEDGRPELAAAFCAKGQAGHLPASVRRAVAARDVRLQARLAIQGTQIPDSIRQGQRVAQTMGQSTLPVAKSAFKFAQHGQTGTWVSELLPYTAKIVDDITVIKTMNTDAINHDPAITFIQTGFQQPGRPSMGAWLSYGLGSENQNLPAFVVLLSQAQRSRPISRSSRGCGRAASCLRAIRASGSAPEARRCSFSKTRRA